MSAPLVITVHGTPAHIARRIIDDSNGCWIWTGALYRDGYACVSFKDKTHQGHRLVLDHLCRVRQCIAPHHLEPVTPRENLRRGDTPAGWDRCQKCGGEFTWTAHQRRCLPCQAAYNEGRKGAKAAAERARRAARRGAA